MQKRVKSAPLLLPVQSIVRPYASRQLMLLEEVSLIGSAVAVFGGLFVSSSVGALRRRLGAGLGAGSVPSVQ